MKAALCLLCAAALAAASPLEVPFYRQEKNGCGAASLAMVMHYWADHYALPETESPRPAAVYDELYQPRLRGIPLATMRDYAESHGFHAFTFRGGAADLEEHLARGRPVLIGLRKKPSANLHFAVLTGMDGNRVWLNDPSKNKPSTMVRKKFDRQWAAADHWLLLVAPR